MTAAEGLPNIPQFECGPTFDAASLARAFNRPPVIPTPIDERVDAFVTHSGDPGTAHHTASQGVKRSIIEFFAEKDSTEQRPDARVARFPERFNPSTRAIFANLLHTLGVSDRTPPIRDDRDPQDPHNVLFAAHWGEAAGKTIVVADEVLLDALTRQPYRGVRVIRCDRSDGVGVALAALNRYSLAERQQAYSYLLQLAQEYHCADPFSVANAALLRANRLTAQTAEQLKSHFVAAAQGQSEQKW